jgi:hypothetical protein
VLKVALMVEMRAEKRVLLMVGIGELKVLMKVALTVALCVLLMVEKMVASKVGMKAVLTV